MANNKEELASEDSPQEMMKRVFAVANLILQSDSYKQISSKLNKERTKHKTEDVLYSVEQ